MTVRIILLSSLLFVTPVVSQEIVHPIAISPIIGDTLDARENLHFSIFPSIQNFRWAVFFELPDGTIKCVFSYARLQKGQPLIEYDTVSVNDPDELREKIERRNLVRRGAVVDVFVEGDRFYRGELLAVDDSFLQLAISEETSSRVQDSADSLRIIPLADVVRIVRKAGDSRPNMMLLGGLGGAAFGALLGFAEGTHQETRHGFLGGTYIATVSAEQNVRSGILTFGILGALAGAAYDMATSDNDDEILSEGWVDASILQTYVRETFSPTSGSHGS